MNKSAFSIRRYMENADYKRWPEWFVPSRNLRKFRFMLLLIARTGFIEIITEFCHEQRVESLYSLPGSDQIAMIFMQ